MLCSYRLLVLTTAVHACQVLLTAESDKKALGKVTDVGLDKVNECVLALLQQGYTETAAKLVTRAKERKVKIRDEVKWAAEELKKQVERVEAIVQDSKEQVAVPAAQWAQSSDKLIMDVKFAHRFDAPGCLDLRSLNVTITETHLHLSTHCLISGEKIKYVLDFDLFDSADTEKSGYKQTSAGHVTIHITKKTKMAWKLPMKGKKPNNLQIWLEMQEKAQADLDSLSEKPSKVDL